MSGLDAMKQRLRISGGNQDGRNVKAKLESMQAALWNSYQGEWINFKGKTWRCLLNPDKETTEYDQKTISIEYNSTMEPGSVFYWNRVKSHWIVFNAKEEEEAYFRASCRRCDYTIDVDVDDAGNQIPYWVYVRGVIETELVWNQKSSINKNQMNYTLMMFVTKDEYTNAFFTRHKKLKFEGHNWKVSVVDRYGQKGIIELYLEEDNDNEMEDAMITPEIVVPTVGDPFIDGEQFVHPYDKLKTYSIMNAATNGHYEITAGAKKVELTDNLDGTCAINIITGKSGEFDLRYTDDAGIDITKKVYIKSL